LKLVREADGSLRTVRAEEPGADLLREVFRDGAVLIRDSWDEIRSRAAL
jgi:hypothetical protein